CIRTPLRLACRARAVWQCQSVPALSRLLPPSLSSPRSGCLQLQRPAATGRRWGSFPHPVMWRLVAHPAIGRFECHFGSFARIGDCECELERVIDHAHGLEHFTVVVDPHDHRASTVKVDAHILSLVFHRSLLPFPGWFGDPECALHIRFLAMGGTPAVRRRGHGSSGHGCPRFVRRPCSHEEPGHAEAAQRFFMTSILPKSTWSSAPGSPSATRTVVRLFARLMPRTSRA